MGCSGPFCSSQSELFAKDFAKPMPSSAFGERLDRQAFLGPWMGTFLKRSTAPKDVENRKSHRGIPIGLFLGIYQLASFIYFHLFSTSEFTGWPSTMIWLDNPCLGKSLNYGCGNSP